METESQKTRNNAAKQPGGGIAPTPDLYQAMLDNCAEAILLFDSDGTILFQNRQLFNLSGYTIEETTGYSVYYHIHPTDLDSVKAFFTYLLTEPALPEQIQYRILHRDGHYFWVLATVTNLLNTPGVNAFMLSFRDITIRKENEKKLADAHRELNKLFNNINDVLFSVDMVNYKLMQVSPACEKIYGYTAQEFLNGDDDLWQQVVYEPDRHHIALQLKCLYEGKTAKTEYRIVNKDGSLHWLENVVIPTLNEQGVLVRIDGVTRDVTEQRNAVETMLKTKANLHSLLDTADTSYVLLDTDLNIVEFNKTAADWADSMMNIELKKGNNVITPLPAQIRAHVQTTLEKVMAGERKDYESAAPDAKGNPFWFHLRMYAIHDNNHAVRGLCIAASDINRRKTAEEQLKKSESEYRSLFEHMQEGVVYCEMVYENGEAVDFIYHKVNERFTGITGIKDAVGKRVTELVPGITISDPGMFMPYQKVLDTGHANSFEIFRNSLGKWLTVTVYPTGGSHFVAVFDDISARKNAEAQILALNESLERKVTERTAELAEANKDLETFNYSVSHDLQSPLRIISGFSKILQDDYKDKLDTNGLECLKHISNSTQRMSTLTRELLSFAQLGKVQLAKQMVDINQVVTNVIAETKLAETNLRAQITVQNLPPANCDEGLIKMVWSNLVQNAVKYSSKKEHPQVEIGICDINGSASYFVKDNGAGFDMKKADNLFGVFKRLHGETDFEGHGIGLALVHRIIARHNGKIWADAKVNEGAAFYFTLPE